MAEEGKTQPVALLPHSVKESTRAHVNPKLWFKSYMENTATPHTGPTTTKHIHSKYNLGMSQIQMERTSRRQRASFTQPGRAAPVAVVIQGSVPHSRGKKISFVKGPEST